MSIIGTKPEQIPLNQFLGKLAFLDSVPSSFDSNVVHITGTESITGSKTFTSSLSITGASPGLYMNGTGNSFIELGSISGASTTPFIDFHSGATAVDFDARIVAFGGNGTSGGGGFNFHANYMNQVGTSTAGTIYTRIVNTSSAANSATTLSLDPGNNGYGVRDAQIKAVNNGSNQINLEFYTSDAAAPVKRLRIDQTGTLDFTPGTITGYFYLGALGANPSINFDANDYLVYDRTGNRYNFFINGVNELSLSSASAVFGGHVKVEDNNNVYVGTGNDLYMVHDGTNTAIVNQTGILNITNTAAGGALILRSENIGGSNLELWATGAYLDASTTFIRNQAGTAEYAKFSSGATEILNGNLQLATSVASNSQLFRFYNSGMGTDKKMTEFISYGTTGNFEMRFVNDAYTQANPILSVTRGTTYLVDIVTIGGNNVYVTNGLTIGGNLTVNGTTTTINATTLTVDDKNIELGSVTTPTNVTADGGGITLKGATDKTILWDNANANWTSSENWNLATGKTLKINNVEALRADALTLQASTATEGGQISLAYGGNYTSSNGGASTWNIDALSTSMRFFRNNSSGVPAIALTIAEDTSATFGSTVTGTSFNSITGLSSTSPAMNGTATVGTGTTAARADHVHPTDTSRLSTGGGTLTGALTLSSTVPSIYFYETDAAVDSKHWLVVADGASFQIQTRTDANAYVANPMTLTRAGNATFTGVVTGTSVVANNFSHAHGNISSASLTTSTTAANQVIMQLASASYRTVEYLIQATSGTSYHTTKIHVIHNGTDIWVNEYGTMFTGSSLATFAVDVSGGQIRLIAATVANAVTVFKVVATTISA
jgi:hypothetical protein